MNGSLKFRLSSYRLIKVYYSGTIYYDEFKESFMESYQKLTKITLNLNEDSNLNDESTSMGIAVLFGQSINVLKNQLEITASGFGVNSLGKINLNIGFKRGDDGWMLNT
jgi:hypothetical protein